MSGKIFLYIETGPWICPTSHFHCSQVHFNIKTNLSRYKIPIIQIRIKMAAKLSYLDKNSYTGKAASWILDIELPGICYHSSLPWFLKQPHQIMINCPLTLYQWLSARLQSLHCVNPSHAKVFRGNKTYMSFLHIDMTQVVEIFP